MNTNGSLALVGSGEYLPQMMKLEKGLIDDGLANGKKPIYVQIPTAAGQESDHRINYWQQLGEGAAKNLGVTQSFLPIFSREDADNPELLKSISDAALIYLSGGDPHYLANTLRDTLAWELILKNWQSGGSLAGCSAGAMVLRVRVIPHFDKFFKWIPDSAAKVLLDLPGDEVLIGIDEDTAVVKRAGSDWQVWGRGKLHILKGEAPGQHKSGEFVKLGSSLK
ncbi:MAG: peptidase [Actinobacteria bacterium]|nr:peptidase [Actinomycetota bacterium]